MCLKTAAYGSHVLRSLQAESLISEDTFLHRHTNQACTSMTCNDQLLTAEFGTPEGRDGNCRVCPLGHRKNQRGDITDIAPRRCKMH